MIPLNFPVRRKDAMRKHLPYPFPYDFSLSLHLETDADIIVRKYAICKDQLLHF